MPAKGWTPSQRLRTWHPTHTLRAPTAPERYAYSGHASYLMNGMAKVIETGPISYERFVLEGIGESHNEEYYAVEDQRFLGEEGFGEELSREAGGERCAQPQRSLLADPENLIIELGEFFEVGTDDLGLHHEVFVDAKLGKSLF